MSDARIAMRAFGDPRTVGAILMLLINDHLLKGAAPVWVTGKLSDFAGLVFFPLLVVFLISPLTSRARNPAIAWAIAITGIWFTAIKTTAAAAGLTERIVEWLTPFTSTIVTDPTDLVALASLLITTRIWSDTRRSTTNRSPNRLRLAIGLAAIASIATSFPTPQEGITDLRVDGEVVLGGDIFPEAISRDGGRSWIETSADDRERWIALWDQLPQQRETTACLVVDSTHCFRIDGTMKVQESSDGGHTWSVAWELEPGRAFFIERAFSTSHDPYDIGTFDILSTDGRIVLVATGEEGVLRRSADGTWDRGPRAAPLSAIARGIQPEVRVIVALLGLSILGLSFVFWSNRLRRVAEKRPWIGGSWATFGRFVWGGVFGTLLIVTDEILFELSMVVAAFAAAVSWPAVSLPWVRLHRADPDATKAALTAASMSWIGSAAGALLGFLLWSLDVIHQYSHAFVLAAALWLAGTGYGLLRVRTAAFSPSTPMPDHHDAAQCRPGGHPWTSLVVITGGWAAVGLPSALTLGSFFTITTYFLLIALLVAFYLAARLSGHETPFPVAIAGTAVLSPAGLLGSYAPVVIVGAAILVVRSWYPKSHKLRALAAAPLVVAAIVAAEAGPSAVNLMVLLAIWSVGGGDLLAKSLARKLESTANTTTRL